MIHKRLIRSLFLVAGLVCVGLGFLGIFLPLLPTTPFILLAAYCFSQSSQRFHIWLHKHGQFGPMIRNWNHHGAISRRAKIAFSVAAVLGLLFPLAIVPVPWWARLLAATTLAMVAVFIWTRPSGPADKGPGEAPFS